MHEYKMKIKKSKSIIILISIIVLFLIVWLNAIKPTKINEDKIEVFIDNNALINPEGYDRSLFDSLINRYNGEEYDQFINDQQLVRTNKELPSDKDEDYKSVAIEIEIKNRSIFDLNNFVATMDIDENSRILYTHGSIVNEKVGSLKTGKPTVMWLEVYCGDITDEELIEYIQNQRITLYYDNPVSGVVTEKVSLKKAKNRKAQ